MKDRIYLIDGVAKKFVNGKEVPVNTIYASDNECCRIDCCKKAIVFTDDEGEKKEIPLQDLYDLLNPSV